MRSAVARCFTCSINKIHTHTHTRAHTHTHSHTCDTHTHTCTHAYKHSHTCTYAHAHTRAHTHTHTRTHTCTIPLAQVYEFARLNLTNTVLSKRKLLRLVETKRVRGWDDPRMPTISGFRRKGFTASILNQFCCDIGVTRVNTMVETDKLEVSSCLGGPWV